MTEPRSDIIRGVKIYPFHQPIPGMPDLYHVACPDHPEKGFCGTYEQAAEHRADHLATEHRD